MGFAVLLAALALASVIGCGKEDPGAREVAVPKSRAATVNTGDGATTKAPRAIATH